MEVKSSEIIAVLPDFGINDPKSHSSSLDDATADRVRDKIKDRKRAEPPAPMTELELPLRKRSRPIRGRRIGRNVRASAASLRPTIPVAGGGKSFRPPIGPFRPPVLSRPPTVRPAGLPRPPVLTPPLASSVAPPLPAKSEPPPKPKPAQATRASDLAVGGGNKPEAPPVVAIGPEVKRPEINLVPGRPKTPKPPLGRRAPSIPKPRVPSPRPSKPHRANFQGTSRAAAPPAPSMPMARPATAPRPAGRPRLPTARPARPVAIPGAPQPTRPPKRSMRPRIPARPIRPPGLAKPGFGPGGPMVKGRISTAFPARSNILVPGQPIVSRRVKASPIPGLPAPTPGRPIGYRPRPGIRPGMPGRPIGRPGPPGRPGYRRPRPPQRRKRDLEALRESRFQKRKRRAEIPKAPNTDIFAADGTTVKELAEKLGIKASQIIRSLVEKGQFATINQPLELESIKEIATYFSATATELTFEEEAVLDIEQEEVVEDIETRSPVVTIMGHVDHGKTSLLDAIRSTNVAAREAGGITQAIGAYQVVKDDKRIVFIDTPGHEAFTKMRAHGASVTDIVVLVVAADDGVMPQTIEAIDHAMDAKVPIIVAVNKIDLPKSEPDRVQQQLSDRGLVPEEWGGETIFCPVSAKTHEGIDNLLEMINLVAEVRELKANPARSAIGVVIEAKLDRGKGPVATVLTQNGTLRVSDTFVVGAVLGRVRALMDDRGVQVRDAGPSSAVVVLGLSKLPEPGDQLSVVLDSDRAKKIVAFREEKAREQAMARTARKSLEQFQEQLAAGRVKELPLIVKSDFQGSATVLQDTLAKLTSKKVKVRVIHSGVGAIKEYDITLAIAAHAIVVGFNVRPERSAAALADREGIDIRLHTVIYELVDELKNALGGLLEPIRKEEFLGRASVLEVFNITNVGTVAGCILEEGAAQSNASARLLRDNIVVHTGHLDSLKRFKDNVKEVRAGQECGIHFERYNDVKKGDEIELFRVIELKQDINELIPV